MARNGTATASFPCSCGHILHSCNPEPGKVLQCPECGAWRRVPLESRPLTYRRRGRKGPIDRLDRVLLYPLVDGPGVALLVVLPPVMWLLSVPIFDLLRFVFPADRTFNPIAVVIVPLTMPLVLGFLLFFGYILLFLGRVLVSSAIGQEEHPRWPTWDRFEIFEGLVRWGWAAFFGIGIGGLPALLYGWTRGTTEPVDRVILVELAAVGIAYAQVALAASLLHDALIAANPVTVVRCLIQLGKDYVPAAVIGAVSMILTGGTLWYVLNRIPNITLAAFGLWGFWVLYLYLSTLVMRAVGLAYFKHSEALGWYRERPRWGMDRQNRIYINS
ncbi:MAG: hypothetical protein U0800_04455 [Isosphaeraceae bacterium]